MRGYYQYYLFDMINMMSAEGGLPTDVHHGQIKVTSQGTPVQISATSVPLKGGIWLAPVTGSCYIGTTAVKPTRTTAIRVVNMNPLFLEAEDLNDWWVDAESSNDTVSYMAW